MAVTNRERVGKAIDLLAIGLQPFVERELKASLGEQWQSAIEDASARRRDRIQRPNLADPQLLLNAVWNHWNNVFARTLGQAERSLVSELREVRNRWAHNEQFSSNDAIRALDSMERMLSAVSAADSAAEVGQMRMDVMRTLFDDQRRQEMRKKSAQPTEGKPQGGLRPWREVATPHPDVASGRYQQAEFAADLWQVYQGEGSNEYKHPTEFFRRTFLTEGLRRLLSQAILRLTGQGGDPVVELQTNFGGGKTHSLLALYHLFSGTPSSDLPGVDDLFEQSKIQNLKSKITSVCRAVFVGTQISPGKPLKKPDGTAVRTVWGEIAWQLGGKEGYKLVKEDDERATNPGSSLKEVFNKNGPCLILIDEWMAYARQLHGTADLPAGTFETQFTFAQALSEAAKAAKNTLLVVSIPASESPHQKAERSVTDIEVGGERGREALARLKNAIGRVEASSGRRHEPAARAGAIGPAIPGLDLDLGRTRCAKPRPIPNAAGRNKAAERQRGGRSAHRRGISLAVNSGTARPQGRCYLDGPQAPGPGQPGLARGQEAKERGVLAGANGRGSASYRA